MASRLEPDVSDPPGLDGLKDYETWKPFDEWWQAPVLHAAVRNKTDDPDAMPAFTRGQLVRHVADKDGGAHVDSSLDPNYKSMSRDNALGLVFSINAGPSQPLNDPAPPSIRQIAYEVLRTYEQNRERWSR